MQKSLGADMQLVYQTHWTKLWRGGDVRGLQKKIMVGKVKSVYEQIFKILAVKWIKERYFLEFDSTKPSALYNILYGQTSPGLIS